LEVQSRTCITARGKSDKVGFWKEGTQNSDWGGWTLVVNGWSCGFLGHMATQEPISPEDGISIRMPSLVLIG